MTLWEADLSAGVFFMFFCLDLRVFCVCVPVPGDTFSHHRVYRLMECVILVRESERNPFLRLGSCPECSPGRCLKGNSICSAVIAAGASDINLLHCCVKKT